VREHDVACLFQVMLQRRTDGRPSDVTRLSPLREIGRNQRDSQATALGSSAPARISYFPSLLNGFGIQDVGNFGPAAP
jgi:hypothetical protein